MSGIYASLGVLIAFFLFVQLVRSRALSGNANLLFSAALCAAFVAELLLFVTGYDSVLSILLLLIGSVVLGPRLGRSLVQRIGHPGLVINSLAPVGIFLTAAAIWSAFATLQPNGAFDTRLVVLLATAGIALMTTAERLHEDRYPGKRHYQTPSEHRARSNTSESVQAVLDQLVRTLST